MRIHLIAIGGAAMHNIALALHQNGHQVSGSDDEIYNPAKARLAASGLLPETEGWHPERLSADIDIVILGMHARADNPELQRALEIGLRVLSYPAFMYEHARTKTRMVIAGSHGKTTTTAMTMHVLRKLGIDFDYLVGAQLEGFETMVRLSDAPVLIVEGDEYLSSCLEPVSKMVQYRPHHAVITGIAWDHVNVFPRFEDYCAQFGMFMDHIEPGGNLFWYGRDQEIQKLLDARKGSKQFEDQAFEGFEASVENGQMFIHLPNQAPKPVQFFGAHNLLNAKAAFHLCNQLGVTTTDFVAQIADFKGAAKRLQQLAQTEHSITWLDFAHAPSKARATVEAVKALYPTRKLTACLELHTFSSLNQAFLPQYQGALNGADQAFVFYSPHTLEMKRMPPISAEDIRQAFGHPNLEVITEADTLQARLKAQEWLERNLLLMSSGTFGGMDLKAIN
jgi:UDP-N-acetylmuramate: L-alanyl-gamma-D-glutamyl-meso-diaminopimelate ligase